MLGRLQAAFEGQQRFIANASHELRTPLAVMRTTVDVVLGNPDSTPGDLRGMAADIRAAVDHAEHLIGALLILARNERGLTVHEEVDLATVAEDVLDTAGLGDRRVHATLEPAVISGDPVLAERLIANLVDNAVRYNTAAGDIWISTRHRGGQQPADRGQHRPGHQPGGCRRIFQPFQRLNDRTSHDGFGLGLAIVASIAAIHGGTVTARPRDERRPVRHGHDPLGRPRGPKDGYPGHRTTKCPTPNLTNGHTLQRGRGRCYSRTTRGPRRSAGCRRPC